MRPGTPIERWPTGGYFSFCTTSRASSAVSTCGTTMPSTPLSSRRVAIAYSPFGTRASGAIPASSAAVADLRRSVDRHCAMLEVEEQPVEACAFHGDGDLDATRHTDAAAERERALFQLSRAMLRMEGMAEVLQAARATAITRFNAARSIGWSVSLATDTTMRWRRRMKMR